MAVILLEQARPGDLRIVERRRYIRITVRIPGRYSLVDRRYARGEQRQFACRAVNISECAIALAAPVCGALGDRVIAHIDQIGRIEGAITRVLSRGFVMSIAASEDERFKLVRRIEWIEKHKSHEVPEHRAHGRFMPTNPYSRLVSADGTTMTCFVIDLSETGAAISAQLDPAIGTVLAVGTIVGRVVRRFVGGFAVQFVEAQSRDRVESLAIVCD